MATLYAKAAGGNWSAAGTWSNVSSAGGDSSGPPAASDNVIFDSGSGNVTLDSAPVCRGANFTGYTGTLTHTSSITWTIGDATAAAGNVALKLVSGMTYAPAADSCAISFVSTSSTQQTIDFGGKQPGNVTFNGAGNKLALTSGFTTRSTTATVTHAAGQAEFDGISDNSGLSHSWGKFVSNSGSTRRITPGSAAVAITGSNSWTVSSSGLTLDSGSWSLTFNAGFSTLQFGGSSLVYNNVTASNSSNTVLDSLYCNILTISAGTRSLTGGGSYNVINYVDPTSARTLTLSSNATYFVPTAAGFNIVGTSGKLMSIVASSAGTKAHISIGSGVVSTDYLSLKDSDATGGATFHAGDNSTNVSGNSGWIFAAYFTKSLTDSISPAATLNALTSKLLSGSITISEVFSWSGTFARSLSDTVTVTEALIKSITRSAITETISLMEASLFAYTRQLTDSNSQTEIVSHFQGKAFAELINETESLTRNTLRQMYDALVGTINYLKLENGDYLLQENGSRIILEGGPLNLNETIVKSEAKSSVDTVTLVERLNRFCYKTFSDTITVVERMGDQLRKGRLLRRLSQLWVGTQ